EPYLPNMKPFAEMYKRNAKINLDGFGIYYLDIKEPEKIQCTKSKYPILTLSNDQELSYKSCEATYRTDHWLCDLKGLHGLDNLELRNRLYRSVKPILDKD